MEVAAQDEEGNTKIKLDWVRDDVSKKTLSPESARSIVDMALATDETEVRNSWAKHGILGERGRPGTFAPKQYLKLRYDYVVTLWGADADHFWIAGERPPPLKPNCICTCCPCGSFGRDIGRDRMRPLQLVNGRELTPSNPTLLAWRL